MTVVAGVAAGKVSWVLAGRRDAVVTGATGAQYLGVIDSDYRRPQVRGVAVLADIRRLNVRQTFADCIRAVMAADTGACDVVVIEIRGQPGDGTVAIVAGVAAGDMGRVLPGSGGAVMTGATGAQYLGVIDSDYRRPQVCGVTVLADIRRLNVCRVFTGCVRAVMAARAVADDIVMIESCR